MKPVIHKVWADDIPKYVVADKDHNCGVGVSSGGTVSFGSGIERCSSLSTIMRNWGGEHLCPGKNFSGQRKQRPYFRRCWRSSGDSFVNGNDFGGVTKFAVVAVYESILVVNDLVASSKAVSWIVLWSAMELVAEMSCVRRSVSGGWASSLVVSRRGGMAAGLALIRAA
ncbi:hypothetical protein Tco_1092988 [Tanacetum coccineum]|uniref:Uncharacterized protein n=1 Tax=Tanacetum coccineum TaxID=301880 RepID=A0ABQ5ICQ4_9ASTR